MAEFEVLPPEVRERLSAIGKADIVVGIPSYQNARTIGHVVRAAQAGLAKYFRGMRGVIMNSDGGSTDGTPAVVLESSIHEAELLLVGHPVHPVQRFSGPYHGLPGKGSAFRSIFSATVRLGARGCAVVDSDLRSITPEWFQLLLTPVVERDFDFVAPYYLRHKYDGTITNSVIYPMTRALYGQRVRQPIGGDFGVSARLAGEYLAQPVWDTDVARYGIDIWMTTTALCGDFRICQAFLGAKIHDPKDPSADLSAMLVQVLGTLFRLMETHEATWLGVQGSRDVPLVGFPFGVGLEPVPVNLAAMVGHFRRGVKDLGPIWSAVFSADDMRRLSEAAPAPGERCEIDDALWVRLVYDLAVAFHHRVMDREHLLRASLPLYMGRVASFIREVADLDALAVEERLERLCVVFEAQKPYLQQRWQSARRPRRRDDGSGTS